jgi:hypothetical protein
MATSTPSNTSKSNCRCDTGCCENQQVKQPGFIGKRPWLLVIAAFGVMFSAWTVMVYFAVTHQPETIPLATQAAE